MADEKEQPRYLTGSKAMMHVASEVLRNKEAPTAELLLGAMANDGPAQRG